MTPCPRSVSLLRLFVHATIRPAHPDDALDLIRLMRLTVPLVIRPATPVGPEIAHVWIRDRIVEASFNDSHAEPGESSVPYPCAYRVAVIERRVVGVAEWRNMDDALFLNSIAVDPNWRGQGIGRQLLCDGIRTWRTFATVELDVFNTMPQVQDWYQRLGFTRIRRRVWVRFPPVGSVNPPNDAGEPTTAETESAILRSTSYVTWQNKTEATAQHQQKGCSMLHLQVQDSTGSQTQGAEPTTHMVGRIGPSIYRITHPQTLSDAAIRTFLRRLNPSRHILYLSSPDSLAWVRTNTSAPTALTDPIMGTRGMHLATSIRMQHTSPSRICL